MRNNPKNFSEKLQNKTLLIIYYLQKQHSFYFLEMCILSVADILWLHNCIIFEINRRVKMCRISS